MDSAWGTDSDLDLTVRRVQVNPVTVNMSQKPTVDLAFTEGSLQCRRFVMVRVEACQNFLTSSGLRSFHAFLFLCNILFGFIHFEREKRGWLRNDCYVDLPQHSIQCYFYGVFNHGHHHKDASQCIESNKKLINL